MGLLDFFRRGKEERSAAQTEPSSTEQGASVEPECSDVLLRALIGGNQMDEKKAMSIAAFAACVDFVTDTTARLPVKLYWDCQVHQTAEEITEDRRVSLLNDDGGDLLTAYDARKAQVRDMLLYGSGHMYIQKYNTQVISLRYVKKQSVSVTVNADPIFKEAMINVGGKQYYPWEFVTITRGSRNGVTGVGLLEQIPDLLVTAYDEMIYERTVAKTGGSKKGFLQAERKLSKSAIDELKSGWREMYASNENNMVVLNDGVKFAPSGNSSVEMQLNEHKLTNAELIAQAFGLSSAVVAGKASTDEYMAAVRTAIIPVVEAYQAALNRSLLTEAEKAEGLYFALDTSELLKGDMPSRFNAYSVALQNNIMSIDEVRYRENLPPLGFNYMRLGLADVLYDPKSGDIITPNTGITQNAAQKTLTRGAQGDIIETEIRKKTNWVKGKGGKFAGSVPMGVRMSKGEYRKIVSEINTNYRKYEGKEKCTHYSLWKGTYYGYKFVNYGFDNYKFTKKGRS